MDHRSQGKLYDMWKEIIIINILTCKYVNICKYANKCKYFNVNTYEQVIIHHSFSNQS